MAEDLLNDASFVNSGPKAWDVLSSIQPKVIQSNVGSDKNSGYQSFFHPQNQYKGIGICFAEISYTQAYPIIFFTPISGIIDVIQGLTP